MKVSGLLVFILLISFPAPGTIIGGETGQGNPNNCRYYPLKTGAEWKLEGIGTTPSQSFKVIGTEEINGTTYFEIEGKAEYNQVQTATIYARTADNKVYWLVLPREELLMFDFNSAPNQGVANLYEFDSETKAARTWRIIDTSMTVEVPAGKFENCYVCEITDSSQKNNERVQTVIYTYWLAPEIGIVKMSANILADALAPIDQWINNLTSYTIP